MESAVQSLRDVAKYVRSKNAGPFWVTIDIFCDSDEAYDRVTAAPTLSGQAVADLYGVAAPLVKIFRVNPLRVVKISFPRPVAQGSARDADSHAGQMFVPLLAVEVA